MSPISSPEPEPVLAELGWGPDLEAAAAGLAEPATEPGRVVRVDRGRLWVRCARGTVAITQTRSEVCTGDWVLVRRQGDAAHALAAVLPRRSALRRAAAGGEAQAQLLAANADAVAVVEGLVPGVNLSRVERLLVMVWSSGAEPVVLLTKADLVPELDAVLAEVAAVAPGVAVLALSSRTGEGFEALASYVSPGRTLALLGRSGVGKSSLCNRLLGEDVAATGSIRDDGKGRHTTVVRELLTVPGGGAVIDTPGLRAAALWAADEGVDRAFADVEELAAGCRFTDCAHGSEPGCAIQAALACGALEERRWASYGKVLREAEWIASRSDARLRSERTKAWKQIHTDLRRHQRNRP